LTRSASQTKLYELKAYLHVIPSIHAGTPLGVGHVPSRFSGTDGNFLVLYAARNLATAISETIIRDDLEGVAERRLFIEEFKDRAIVQLSTTAPLRMVDLRKGGCLKLGISTEVAGAKGFEEAQRFSQFVHDHSQADGILYASRLTGENCAAVFDRAIHNHLVDQRTVPLIQLRNLSAALASLSVELVR
jgi:hypothetical protein